MCLKILKDPSFLNPQNAREKCQVRSVRQGADLLTPRPWHGQFQQCGPRQKLHFRPEGKVGTEPTVFEGKGSIFGG